MVVVKNTTSRFTHTCRRRRFVVDLLEGADSGEYSGCADETPLRRQRRSVWRRSRNGRHWIMLEQYHKAMFEAELAMTKELSAGPSWLAPPEAEFREALRGKQHTAASAPFVGGSMSSLAPWLCSPMSNSTSTSAPMLAAIPPAPQLPRQRLPLLPQPLSIHSQFA